MSSDEIISHIEHCESCQELQELMEHAKTEEQFFKLHDQIEQCWINSFPDYEPEFSSDEINYQWTDNAYE
jgi:hypothetical protein